MKTENSLACCAQGMPASMAASYQRLLQNVGNGLGQQFSEVKMAECRINGNSGWLQGATEMYIQDYNFLFAKGGKVLFL